MPNAQKGREAKDANNSIHIKIGSHNSQGINQNRIFTENLLKKLDILCIQEHWLWSFELSEINKIAPEHHMTAKAADEEDVELEHSSNTTGKGGVAIIWNGKVSPYMAKMAEDSTSRILVSLCNLPKSPLCIINCYLPSGTHKRAIDKFREDIDILQELLLKYQATHEVIIIGDLNADHYHRHNLKENLLLQLIADNNLLDLGKSGCQKASYENPHLGHKSRIDHILIKRRDPNSSWTPIQVSDESEGINTSYHHPINTTYTVLGSLEKRKTKNHDVKTILKHKELDREMYHSAIMKIINDVNWNILPTEDAVKILQKSIWDAATQAAPVIKIKTNKKSRPIPWTPELAAAVKRSKAAHFNWKQCGKPTGDNVIWNERKTANKAVRSIQRRQRAEERTELIKEISSAMAGDQTLAHKLIRRQRTQKISSSSIWIDGQLTTDVSTIRQGWAEYCHTLASGKHNAEEEKMLGYMRMLSENEKDLINISPEQVIKAIKTLKPNKAIDPANLNAELLKELPAPAITVITQILNRILGEKRIPGILKEAYKLMIPKPGKDIRDRDNYRGITIASILLKILEIICMEEDLECTVQNVASDLQFGFTKHRSPSMASLVITEVTAEARKQKLPMYVTSLDARKAFDVVHHFHLKHKLFTSTIKPSWWMVIDNLYTESTEYVRWEGVDSTPFQVSQGVKQGSIVSPTLYKMYINDLLLRLQGSGLGAQIGSLYLGNPTCADDVTLLTNNIRQVQPMLEIASAYANEHKYQLHPKKTVITPLLHPTKGQSPVDPLKWNIDGQPVSSHDNFTHLGLNWSDKKGTPDIQVNIQKARRTAFSLLGVGLHGTDGLDPLASHKILQTYVTPRLLHGLEAIVPGKDDILQLEIAYRKWLRQIQALPSNTATEAIYILLDTIPLEGQLHQKSLSLFGSICRLPFNHVLRCLAKRQLAMCPGEKNSWFAMIIDLGARYNLDIFGNLNCPKPKLQWKREVKQNIKMHWTAHLHASASEKRSLKWMILDAHRKIPGIWLACKGETYLVGASCVRARMLTGRFQTGTLESLYNKSVTDPTCRLCQEEKEDIWHMLAVCRCLEDAREPHISRIKKIYQECNQPPPNTTQETCSALLNGDSYVRGQPSAGVTVVQIPENQERQRLRINKICSQICSNLAKRREALLSIVDPAP